MSDPTAIPANAPTGPRPKYKRRLSNYLLDKKLQLRYVLVVTILSGIIAGALGFMIYQQRRAASESISRDLQVLTDTDASQSELQEQITSDLASDDQALVYKMVGVGVGLVIILSLYLLIMTHKVAGPLYKVSLYFDKMAAKKLGVVTPLREGDMLQDFYASFKEMHESVRATAQSDLVSMEESLAALRTPNDQADYRGEARQSLTEALDALAEHLEARKVALRDR